MCFRRLAGFLQVKAVEAYLDELFEQNVKFLVFAHHKEMLVALEHACNR